MQIAIVGSGCDRIAANDRAPDASDAAAGDAAAAIVRAVAMTPGATLAIVPELAPLVAATLVDLAPPRAAEAGVGPERLLSLAFIGREAPEAMRPFRDVLAAMYGGETIDFQQAIARADVVFILGNAPRGLPRGESGHRSRVVYFASLLPRDHDFKALHAELADRFGQVITGEELVRRGESERLLGEGLGEDEAEAAFTSYGLAAEVLLDGEAEEPLPRQALRPA